MKEILRKATWSLSAEFIFNCLPVAILVLINYSSAKQDILTIKDFLFVAIILYGQSIVKFSSGVSAMPKKSNWQFVALFVTLVIALGLAPSCILLALFYSEGNNQFTQSIARIEIVLSVVTFFIIGLTGQFLLERGDKVVDD